VASLFETLGIVLFFAFGLHRELFRILAGSFRTMPAGRFRIEAGTWARWATDGLGQFFEIGVRVVAPVFVVLLLVTLTFGLLMRAVPTVNVFDIGFVLRVFVAFGLMAALLPRILPVVEDLYEILLYGLHGFTGG
jgi:flagellar biosynthetic protein FliR